MSRSKTYSKAVQDLKSREKSLENLSTQPVETALSELGNPEDRPEIILVAGSNGKGSVVEMISHMLTSRQHEVGSFKSPGLTGIKDRIRENGDIIDTEEFADLYSKVKQVSNSDSMSMFEYVTAMAYLCFQNMDYAVMEVGLGGEKDATNAAANEYSVVTNIQLEHTSVLGSVRSEIAESVCGIETDTNITSSDLAASKMDNVLRPDTPRHFFGNPIVNGQIIRLPLRGSFQVNNFFTAVEAVRAIDKLPQDLKSAFEGFSIPGRMEVMQQNPLVIVDGAHNAPAIEKIAKSIPEDSVVVFACTKTKTPGKMIKVLKERASNFVMTEFDQKNSYSCEKLSQSVPSNSVSEPVPEQALSKAKAIASDNQPIFVTGSLYLVGQIKSSITG